MDQVAPKVLVHNLVKRQITQRASFENDMYATLFGRRGPVNNCGSHLSDEFSKSVSVILIGKTLSGRRGRSNEN
jgi:hypothetical protein